LSVGKKEMKICILPVYQKLQPTRQIQLYPAHNKDFGVEQDFFQYLLHNQHLVTENPKTADWHYLPIFWTRWHVNHNFAQNGHGLEELQNAIDQFISNEDKTFTICQYDDGPLVNLGSSTVFLASRKTSSGIDIPLLSSPHRKPFIKPRRKYLASFVGRFFTHEIRQQMFDAIKSRKDVYLFDGDKGIRFYVQKMLQSQIALCPRGYGGSSFRFFEAMQLGVVPFLLGDIDTRPFKRQINWDGISFYLSSTSGLNDMLNSLDQAIIKQMGELAANTWQNEITYQRWCKYVIRELEAL
jgi:hypothetical protein